MSDALIGQQLGQYELHQLIGKGGMAMVYRASQPRIEREVAIKVIAETYLQYPSFARRFEQEMRAAVQLQHPHILPVYDVSLEGDRLYMVMAYLTGGTLGQRIARSPGGLPLEDAVCIASQIASALDYAHAQGIIHRDVKPGNILLDARGNAYLSDFGIAQLAEAEHLPAAGTFAYMAPDLLDGSPASPASDIYSLGTVIFEMLAGQRPFEAHDREALLELYAKPGIPAIRDIRSDLPPGIQVVLEQALSRNPVSRPPNASALVGALHRASGLAGLPCADQDGDHWSPGGAEEDEAWLDDLQPEDIGVITPLPEIDLPAPPQNDLPALPPLAEGKSPQRLSVVSAPPTHARIEQGKEHIRPQREHAQPGSRPDTTPLLLFVWITLTLGLIAIAVLVIATLGGRPAG